ncbi:MAG: polysaccharide biosynthesis tyrosine autokinase [Verrucomicrobia bacterium]|nr:polysaccharide biosynthesis tyrosine autokinase [Verrucomicrobiota bacterium]
MENSLLLPPQNPGQSSTLSRIHETSAKFQRYKILLRRRWWFLLLTASIGVCVMALRITGKPDTYQSLAKLVAGGRIVAQEGNVGWQEQLTDFYGTIIETLESAEMKKRALARVHALHPDLKDTNVEIRVAQTKGSAIFNVFAVGSEKTFTKIFLDAMLDEFVAFRQQIREQGLERALNTFTETVVKKSKELQERTERLEAFRKANNMVLLTNGNNEAAAFLLNLRAKREMMNGELTDIKNALEDVDAAMVDRERGILAGGNAQPAQPGTSASAPAGDAKPGLPQANLNSTSVASLGMTSAEHDYLETKKSIMQIQNERTSLIKYLKPGHPDVVRLEEQIESAKTLQQNFADEIVKEMRSRESTLKRQLGSLDKQIEEKQKEAIELGGKLAEHERLEEEFRATKLAHDQMFERVQKFQDFQNVQTDYVAIQEHASPAYKNVEDWIKPLLGGLVGGMLLGMIVLVLFDRLDDRMNSFSEFQGLFPAEAVLGQIPEQRQRGDVALLRPNDDRHLYAEAFRNVRSSILFKNWQGKPPKTILVTSAVPNEGKTTVTSNLAVTMATSGARVLLADCDLRRGGVSELFKLPGGPGLSEVLLGKLHWRDAVQETGIRGLDLLARGEVFDQTSEMLLSKTAEEMLREMGDEYDYVIFDSAPVLVADDTASFAPKIDVVLFVVRLSSTMARLTGKALDLLYDRQVNVGGVILNRSTTNLKEYTYYNYASYYYAPKKPSEDASTAKA